MAIKNNEGNPLLAGKDLQCITSCKNKKDSHTTNVCYEHTLRKGEGDANELTCN